jgi:hypothetical protein
MASETEEKLAKAKFVCDLKPLIADQAARIDRIQAVLIEHAKLLDPAAFNEDPPEPVVPAEAATDAPT